ncbi:InlB B-repeat-containing protein [Luteimicrobium sp. NPDC057192]|uniref:InlB B-repeat-containing protein n=1 Tax=Luteimicrobium sp. NPDC057192 TaxID=3346042 RepID=UPI0036317A38
MFARHKATGTRSKRRWLRGACALVAVGALVGPAAAVPASADAPVGSETTPGIWGTHVVTFVSLGRTLSTVEVADGGHAPRQPAPPAADGVFSGWFVTVGGVEVPFDFDTTVVESDLTVTAHFTDTHIVQFLAPEALTPSTRVLDTDEIADGAAVGAIAPDVPQVPNGTVFTGNWYVDGDASETPYDFSAPLTANLVLRPVLADGFAVSFVTDGTAVEPVFVLEPKTQFTQADLDAVPTPTRVGYRFTGWFRDEARTVPADPPFTSTTTLYAGWAGEDVEYHVSYWLEKPGIVPANYPDPVFTAAGGALPAWGPSDGALSDAQLHDRTWRTSPTRPWPGRR